MKFKYKVTDNEGKVSDMEAMSFKKLRRKLDHKQNYVVEYTNKKGNHLAFKILHGRKEL